MLKNPEALGLYKLSHSNMQIQPFLTGFQAKSNRKNHEKLPKSRTFKLRYFIVYLFMLSGFS
jgi:hypothetical protein